MMNIEDRQLIEDLLTKLDDVLDGMRDRAACRIPVAIHTDGTVLCDDGTTWDYTLKDGWTEEYPAIPGGLADTYNSGDDDAEES